MIIFLLCAYYWIAPDGYISARFDKPVKEKQGFVCVKSDIPSDSVRKWRYEVKDKKFVRKDSFRYQKIGNELKMTQGLGRTRVDVIEWLADSMMMKQRAKRKEYLLDVNVEKNLTQSWQIGKIEIFNRLCYPMKKEIIVKCIH